MQLRRLFMALACTGFISAGAQTAPYLAWNKTYNRLGSYSRPMHTSYRQNQVSRSTTVLTHFTKKGQAKKTVYRWSTSFNSLGLETQYTATNTRNNHSYQVAYTYRDSLLIFQEAQRNGHIICSDELSYNPQGRITEHIVKNKNGTADLRREYTYDASGTHVTSAELYTRKEKSAQAIYYTYSADFKMSQAQEYKKGKLLRIWNYTCDIAGENEAEGKTVKVCKDISQDAEGNRVESNRITQPNGKLVLEVSVYNKENKLISKKGYDDVKHLLEYEYTLVYKANTIESNYRIYTKKGKLKLEQKRVLAPNDQLLMYEVGNLSSRSYAKSVYTYNDKDLLQSIDTYDRKGRRLQRTEFSYEF